MTDYKEIFYRIEQALKDWAWFSETEFDKCYGRFKKFENKKRTDQELYEMLVLIVFYSGFRASTVEQKEHIILRHLADYKAVSDYTDSDLQRIMSDSSMIKNQRKIEACIKNAKVFRNIIEKNKSFQNYLDKFNLSNSLDDLILLKEELEYKFDYLGGITVYHLLTDLGYNVLKPDRVILRIFKRLGLIESEKQLLKAVIQGRKFANQTGIPIRYIDIIFVKFGQQGESKMFGIKDGICLEKNPKCDLCKLTEYCNYDKI